MKCFSYTPDYTYSDVLFVTHIMLVLVKCFSYTPDANFSEVFLFHTSCFFLVISLAPLIPLLRCFSYTHHASLVTCFSYTPQANSSEVLLLHTTRAGFS